MELPDEKLLEEDIMAPQDSKRYLTQLATVINLIIVPITYGFIL